jgi:hypothetical protein
MRKLLAAAIVVACFSAFGCSGDSATTEGTPKVEGKVDVKDMPEGTSAPGDKRTSPADTGAKTDSDSRG